MTVEALAHAIYSEFKSKPESQHIASKFALVELSKLIAELKPARILEVGAGIGTITKMVLQHPARPQMLVVTEAHPVCLRELERNLFGLTFTGYKLISNPQELDISQAFELVIFDGTLDDERQYAIFAKGTTVFVEGGRAKTIEALREKLRRRGLGLTVETRRPSGKKLKLKSKRKLFGLPLPAFKLNPMKGCSVGRVV